MTDTTSQSEAKPATWRSRLFRQRTLLIFGVICYAFARWVLREGVLSDVVVLVGFAALLAAVVTFFQSSWKK